MTNYEKYFGTPEDAADSIESFMTNDVFHIGAWMSYTKYVTKNFDCRRSEREHEPWLYLWLKEDADA